MNRLSTDFKYFAAATLKIVSKAGELVPFILNKSQKSLLRTIQKQEKAKKPVRIIILKARQLGMSTFISAYYFWKILTRKHQSALIVADEHKDAQGLLNKCQIYYDNLPEVMRPAKKYRTKRELYFERLNSSVETGTASDKSLGRSRTFQLVHLSECAFFPNEGEAALLSLRQTIALNPNTYVVMESTANGLDNLFYDEVRRARGSESEYELVFFPWYEEPSYRIGEPEEIFSLTEEEETLKKKYKLDYAQIRWRRYTIANQCAESLDKFKQEYPSNIDEAFVYSGHPVFHPLILKEIHDERASVQYTGSINIALDTLEEKKNGELEIYSWPEKDRVYSIGIDPALGIEDERLDRDYSVVAGIDALSKEQVFQWRGRLEWDIVARIAVFLGELYNRAYLVPEGNNHGLAVISKIKDMHYPFLYKERNYAEGSTERKDRLGFLTTNRTKPMLISYFVELFREKLVKPNSLTLIEEMSKFTQDKKGRMQSTTGHDDTVIAFALALWGTRYAPVRMAVEQKQPIKIGQPWKFRDIDKITRRGDNVESDWLQKTFPHRFN